MVLQVKCVQTDLPKDHRKSVVEAVRKIYLGIVEGEESWKDSSKKRNIAGRWGDFARSLKRSLDNAYKPHWHVMVGTSIGFACKHRKKSVALLYIMGGTDMKPGEKLTVVIWKSPGTEGPRKESETPAQAQAESSDAKEDVNEAESMPGNAVVVETREASYTFHVVRPNEAEVETGSEVHTTISVLRSILQPDPASSAEQGPPKDSAELAQLVRNRLTVELSTIWHVAVGRDFVLEPAEDSRNFVSASFGKERIVCFQHEQPEAKAIDWFRIASTFPYAVMTLLGCLYMACKMICKPGEGGSVKSTNMAVRFVDDRICTKEDWEYELGIASVLAIGLSVVVKRLLRYRES
jgi:hypothetical protein